jgi:tRNA nucleotidyltransferase (CCA-adding enzyme)
MPSARQLLKGLQPRDRSVVRLARKIAERQRVPLYLVGGALRDLLLGTQPKDVDLLIEGSVHRFARELAAHLQADLEYQSDFLTTTVWMGDRPVNIARARTETYSRPGALPKVKPAKVEDDLPRRDFSMNAMALGLTGRHSGALLDPCGGRADLAKRVLRVLHDRSFVDDPTRIFRGVRLSARLKFRFEPATMRLARGAIRQGLLGRVSADRWRCEILLMLAEPDPVAAIKAGRRVGLVQELLPRLRGGSRLRTALRRVPGIVATAQQDSDTLRLLTLCGSTGSPADTARRLGLQGSALAAARALERSRGLPSRLASSRPSAVVRLLERLPVEAVCALAALTTNERAHTIITRFLVNWRFVRPCITGADLLREGIAPGPAMGEGLRAARYALIDGKANTREQQLAVALSGVRRYRKD